MSEPGSGCRRSRRRPQQQWGYLGRKQSNSGRVSARRGPGAQGPGRARRSQSTLGAGHDDQACLGKGMAQISWRLRTLLVDVEPLEGLDLSDRFRREFDHRPGINSAPSAVTPCSASTRSVAARNRSRMGIKATRSPATICALLRSRLASYPAGGGRVSGSFDMTVT